VREKDRAHRNVPPFSFPSFMKFLDKYPHIIIMGVCVENANILGAEILAGTRVSTMAKRDMTVSARSTIGAGSFLASILDKALTTQNALNAVGIKPFATVTGLRQRRVTRERTSKFFAQIAIDFCIKKKRLLVEGHQKNRGFALFLRFLFQGLA